MAKYRVYIKEASYGYVTIEADNEDGIYEKAQHEYFSGNVDWAGGDFDIKDYQKVED